MAQSSSSKFPEQFRPGPTCFFFPKRKFGKDERSFRADWCDKHKWLHYDAEKDAAFCYVLGLTMIESFYLVQNRPNIPPQQGLLLLEGGHSSF